MSEGYLVSTKNLFRNIFKNLFKNLLKFFDKNAVEKITEKFTSKITLRKIGLLFSLLIGVSLLFSTIEVVNIIFEIKKLKSGYIKVTVNYENELPNYEWTKKRPREWVSLKEISPYVIRAVILSEDGSFYLHHGLDIEQIKTALNDTIMEGRAIRGASTITQQLVKNLYLNRSKSIWRKLKEAILAVQLERTVSKRRILEIYLNIIEYGENLYGIGPASHHYFKRPAGHLTAREGAFIAMLLPNPKRYSASFRQGKLTSYARSVMKRILQRMVWVSYLSSESAQAELHRKFTWER